MPKIQVPMTDSEGWKPLPKGTYAFIIDSVEQTMSSKNNPQLRLKTHVIQHPQYSDKKSTLFLPMVARAAFRVREILDATGIDFEETEVTGQQDEEGNEIKCNLDFDTDDLVGATFVTDVDVEPYNGKDQNRFSNIRPLEATPRPAGASAPAAQQQGAATPPTNAGVPAQGAAPVRRRRIMEGPAA